jgi:hypothetical protein
VPDPDGSDPEIIDFSPKPTRTRRPMAIAIAAAAVIGVAAAVVFVVIKPGATAASHANPALARLIAGPNLSRPRRVVQCDGRCEEGP